MTFEQYDSVGICVPILRLGEDVIGPALPPSANITLTPQQPPVPQPSCCAVMISSGALAGVVLCGAVLLCGFLGMVAAFLIQERRGRQRQEHALDSTPDPDAIKIHNSLVGQFYSTLLSKKS